MLLSFDDKAVFSAELADFSGNLDTMFALTFASNSVSSKLLSIS
jgi:hypothetical protein